MHAIDRVRQVVEDAGSLIDAADALADDADDSNEIESLPLEPGRSDVVRIMNLHKAKGLEADVVFLADPCGGFKPRVDVHIERKGNVAHGWFQVIRRSETSFATTLLGEHADWAIHAAAEDRISRPSRIDSSTSPRPGRGRCSSSVDGLVARGSRRGTSSRASSRMRLS